MDNDLVLQLPKPEVAIALQALRQVEGVGLRIVNTQSSSAPDFSKSHPSYHLDFINVAQIVISLAGAATGLLALATALVNLKKAQEDNAKAKSKGDSVGGTHQQIAIMVQNIEIIVEKGMTPETLEEAMNEVLKR